MLGTAGPNAAHESNGESRSERSTRAVERDDHRRALRGSDIWRTHRRDARGGRFSTLTLDPYVEHVPDPVALTHLPATLGTMKDKSHMGQRHKGCGLCDIEKRAGNGAARHPARDLRQIEAAKAQIEASR